MKICTQLSLFFACLLFVTPFAIGQDEGASGEPADAASPAADAAPEAPQALESWDRLIYLPFKDLKKALDNQNGSVVIPYREYVELMEAWLKQTPLPSQPAVIITASRFTGKVEGDVARLNLELDVNVLQKKGLAPLPLEFGNVAVGKLQAADDQKVLLRGVSHGKYDLLFSEPGAQTVSLELLVPVQTSPESRSFAVTCPAAAVSELTLTIPEPDQDVSIAPMQLLMPSESGDDNTVVKASLGATRSFSVSWNPEAGSKPVMDLLTSVSNKTAVRVEPGLVQSSATFTYEILRGQMADATILVPLDADVIDVSSSGGRIREWKVEKVEGKHQQIRIDLLTPAEKTFQVTLQTEQRISGDEIQLIGQTESGALAGLHADAVVRESGRLSVTTDSSLTTLVKAQTGAKRVSGNAKAGAAQSWEFSGRTGKLVLQVKPVEPRLLVDQQARLIFGEDELRLTTKLTYTVERAGVFELNLTYPDGMKVVSVRADGMSEFNVDKDGGKIALQLTQKRQGKIVVDITATQPFDSTAEGLETDIPTITPEGVERETGRITIFAPKFLDVATVDSKLTGLFPAQDGQVRGIGQAVRVSEWNYTQRPFTLAVKSTPRPSLIAAHVATTADVQTDVMKVTSVVRFDVQNAGIDTYRISVPEAVADQMSIRSLNNRQKIQQRDRSAAAEDGWVTWTLTLQNEVTGEVAIETEWKLPISDMEGDNATQQLSVAPVRVLAPFDDDATDKRKVSLTQTRGEIRFLRHESLSISAEGEGDTLEQIDVRELEKLPQDGYAAFRYFAQPVSTTVTVKRHEVHDVVATVVSKAAVEVVTDHQQLANFRARYRVLTSERQRLRIDLPAGAELRAPLLNTARTTLETATDVTPASGWEAYYVNISRTTTSDQEFLLTLQFRAPLVAEGQYPYEGQGGKQVVRLPLIGDDSGGTVVQETRVAIWSPKEVSFVGEPENWSLLGDLNWSFLNPLKSPSAPGEANELDRWVGGGSTDFAQQGNVSVFRAIGRNGQLNIVWWNRPFLVAVISGALLFVGFILRRTSWENRLTLVVMLALGVAIWGLKDSSETLQFVTAGSWGLMAGAAIWLVSLFVGGGRMAAPAEPSGDPPGGSTGGGSTGGGDSGGGDAPAAPEPVAPAKAQPVPAASLAVTPSPDVSRMINDMMGGK